MDWQVAGGTDLKLIIEVKQPIFKVTRKELEIFSKIEGL